MGEQRCVEITPDIWMPMVGLGTWSLQDTYAGVRVALDAGYRHFDTANQYGNEGELGRALADAGIARDDVFVTTKILSVDAGREEAILANSLRELRSDYVDLWLIHDPPPPGASEKIWEFLIGARERGLARAIGVSEYGTSQLDAIVTATGVTPAVNQIRWAPALYDPGRVEDMRARGVQLEGFSVLRLTDLDDPRLVEIAAAHGVGTAQVLVRWHVDHGIVTIPRSSTPGRIAANLDVWDFELSPAELAVIDAMSVVGQTSGCHPDADLTLLGAVGTVIAPTGVPTGAGEIDLPGQPATLAWSVEEIRPGTTARVVGLRGRRAVEIARAEQPR